MSDPSQENDLGFTSLWSEKTNFDFGTFFVNPKLSSDIFFDKFTKVTQLNREILYKIISLFKENNIAPFVYIQNNPAFEELLLTQNFRMCDIQYVMKKNPTSDQKPFSMRRVNQNDLFLWAEIFCKSFDCKSWFNEVLSILQKTWFKADYLIDSEHHASCMALFESNSILGLYCLGTIHEFRDKGFARSMINYGSILAREKNLEFLMIETFSRDNLLQFYKNLGFEIIEEKKIFTI